MAKRTLMSARGFGNCRPKAAVERLFGCSGIRSFMSWSLGQPSVFQIMSGGRQDYTT